MLGGALVALNCKRVAKKKNVSLTEAGDKCSNPPNRFRGEIGQTSVQDVAGTADSRDPVQTHGHKSMAQASPSRQWFYHLSTSSIFHHMPNPSIVGEGAYKVIGPCILAVLQHASAHQYFASL
ncbi:hypothetical protein ElyMa_004694500 [Elysia marginata]|uniref:Uncharacterized protein n=1 Tax=Elysia marginata TaxID=1093978 RepID=A0AAV4I784_9GAST|nr:hypothetical protein ElyMa_004694500 [Elysia marginata]